MNNLEAIRCLMCKEPRCSERCPVHTSIPQCIALYREGKLQEAGKILFENNPLCAITSRICDWSKTCSGHCVLNSRNMPVRWYEIEQEISDLYLSSLHIENPHATLSQGDVTRHVGIVGAGPSGIAGAFFLKRKGLDVTVFDAHQRIGGVMRYGIPDFRLDKKILEEYERLFDEAGIVFMKDTRIGSAPEEVQLEDLSRRYDAVLVATGAEVPLKLGIPGEESPDVIFALDFLKHPSQFHLGENVIVIGGGNVAMDACRLAHRLGHQTWVYYRKTFENMPANLKELRQAQEEGVRFNVFQAPVAVKGHHVIFRDCENVTGAEGKIATRIIDGTDHEVECDTLVVAISETIDLSVFGSRLPALNRWNYPIVNGFNRIEGSNVFVAGDFILGPQTVAHAVESASLACEGIVQYLEQ
jgi:glutamate synthase (NADPH/NADH) small chain